MNLGRLLGGQSKALGEVKEALLRLEPAPLSDFGGLPSGSLHDALEEVGQRSFPRGGGPAAWVTREPADGISIEGSHTVRLLIKQACSSRQDAAGRGQTEFLYLTRLAEDRWTWFLERS